MSYQVLLSQGKQQAISLSRGVLDLVRFEHLKHRLGEHLLRYWKVLLTLSLEESPYELDHMTEALTTARKQEWEAHLFDVVEAELARKPLEDRNRQEKRLRLYSILEVQEVSALMESSRPTPLSAVLEHEDGTMRFGHAIVPNDGDLKLLLVDVEHYGVNIVAALLRLLSTLRYVPRKEGVSHVEDEQNIELDQDKRQDTPDETADANIPDV